MSEEDDKFESEEEVFQNDRPLPVFHPVWPKPKKPQFFILDADHQVVPCDDLIAWGQFFEKTDARRVAKTQLNGLRVSTVFLGLDHAWGSKPLFFETMIFPDEDNAPPEIYFERIQDWAHGYQMRYSTWDEAVEGHEQVVTTIREGLF